MKKTPLQFMVIALLCLNFSLAQSIWRQVDVNEVQTKIGKGTKEQFPTSYNLYNFSFSNLKNQLALAPEENFDLTNSAGASVSFPFEDGHVEDFNMKRVYYMHKDLNALYPEIQSYVGVSKQNPLHKIYISLSADNFYGVINGEKIIYLDPYKRGESDYVIVYNRKNFNKATDDDFSCSYVDEENAEEIVQFGT